MPAFEGVWMINREIKGVHRFPDNPGVIRSYEGRGWEVTDLPTDLEDDDPDFMAAVEELLAEDPAELKPAKTKKSAEAKSATDQEGSK